jgi:hypothetical protein
VVLPAVVLLVQLVPHAAVPPALVAPALQVPREPELLVRALQVLRVAALPLLAPVVLAQVRPEVLVPVQPPRRRLLLPLPQVVVESGEPLHLQVRQSFSAVMARSSPRMARPTYAQAPSTR